MFEKEKNDDAIEKLREDFTFEDAWEMASNLEGVSVENSPYSRFVSAIAIYNKTMNADRAG